MPTVPSRTTTMAKRLLAKTTWRSHDSNLQSEHFEVDGAPPRHLLAQRHAVAVADVRARTASTARSRRISRTCTSPTRSSACSTAPRGAASRSCSSSRATTRPSRRGARAARRARASRTSSPTSCGAASGRSSAGCCRTRTSARSSRDDLARLREVTASQGLMLESMRADLVAHQGSPTKDPALRLADDPRRGRAADPVHERDPRRDRRDRGGPRWRALEALAAVHAEHGHLQEVILQNFVPHRRYYGEEPAEIATEAAERYWRTGLHATRRRPRAPDVGDAGRRSRT